MKRSTSLTALVGLILGVSTMGVTPAKATHGNGAHWFDQGLTNAYVYFDDNTGSAWPVGSVISRWNTASGDAQIVLYWQDSCPSGDKHCVPVREYTDATGAEGGCIGDYGCAYRPVSNNHYYNVRVWLNNTTVTTTAQHRKTTCHELGHAIGLEHRSTDQSCMRQGASPPISQYPDDSDSDPHDTEALENTYSHSG